MPFSSTAWPLSLPGYIVCAIDIADERDLGAAILRSARAGSFPWLKYINVGNQHYHCRDGFQSSKFNSDTHNHLSIRTDWIDRTIGEFDPFGDTDMGLNFNEQAKLNAIINFSPTMILDVDTPSEDGTGTHKEFPVPFVAEIEKLAVGLSALKQSSVDVEALAEALRPHIQAAAEAAVLKAFSDQAQAK